MDDQLTKQLVRIAAGLFIAVTVGAGLTMAWRWSARQTAKTHCAQIEVPERCPEGQCSYQDKINVFERCMAERGHFFR